MKKIFLLILTSLLILSCSLLIVIPVSAGPPTDADYFGLGAHELIYSSYHGKDIAAGILMMKIPPSEAVVPSYCIDLYKQINIGNTLIAGGHLSDANGDVNWCAVNYILNNFDYSVVEYADQNEEAAAIQAAIWYFTTAPYGTYPGTDGKYQFMTDPLDGLHYDAEQIRDKALTIVAAAEENCKDGFKYPSRINLQGNTDNACENNRKLIIATVNDQKGQPIGAGIDVVFETTPGGHLYDPGNPDSSPLSYWKGTINEGYVSVLFTADIGTTPTVTAWVSGKYGSLLYDPSGIQQNLTTTSLLPYSISNDISGSCTAQDSFVDGSLSFNSLGAEELEVGGALYPTNKLIILTPFIVLAIVIAVGTTIVVRRRLNQS